MQGYDLISVLLLYLLIKPNNRKTKSIITDSEVINQLSNILYDRKRFTMFWLVKTKRHVYYMFYLKNVSIFSYYLYPIVCIKNLIFLIYMMWPLLFVLWWSSVSSTGKGVFLVVWRLQVPDGLHKFFGSIMAQILLQTRSGYAGSMGHLHDAEV